MNEQQFNASLKAAFVAPEMPVHMDHKIDAAVARIQNNKMVRRRLTLSFGATAMIVAGVFVFPAVRAQASLGGMMSALDKQTSAKILTYTIDEQGNRIPKGTTIIANGDVESRDSQNRIEQVEIGEMTFAFDSNSNSFIRSRRNSQGIRLSQMVSPASKFRINKRVALEKIVVNGREILRATITDTGLPERTIIEADPQTDLPFHVSSESLEMGKWRVRQEFEFVYQPGLNVNTPDFTKTPVLTIEQSRERFIDSMTKSELGRLKLKDRTIIIRKVDVANDGTVFVGYQAGNMNSRRWTGSYLTINDSLGTEYVQSNGPSYNGVAEGSFPKEGRLELEMFIPVKPQIKGRKTLSLYAFSTEAGASDAVSIGTNTMNGKTEVITMHNGNQDSDSEWKGSKQKILDLRIGQPTCSVRPTWAGSIDWTMMNDVYVEISKSERLSADAMRKEKWEDAARFLNDTLHWKRESEIQGLSGWEMGQTLKDLETVKKHLQPK